MFSRAPGLTASPAARHSSAGPWASLGWRVRRSRRMVLWTQTERQADSGKALQHGTQCQAHFSWAKSIFMGGHNGPLDSRISLVGEQNSHDILLAHTFSGWGMRQLENLTMSSHTSDGATPGMTCSEREHCSQGNNHLHPNLHWIFPIEPIWQKGLNTWDSWFKYLHTHS